MFLVSTGLATALDSNGLGGTSSTAATTATFIHSPVDFLCLVFGLEAGSSHRVDTLGVERVLGSKVGLRVVSTFGVEFDRGIVTAKFFMLLSHCDVAHDHDCDEVLQLEAQIISNF